MSPRGRSALLAALALAQSVSSFAQVADPGFELVPAANLSEGTLTVPEDNFSIRAPGPQWDWLRDKPAKGVPVQNYLCRNLRTGERFMLSITRATGGGGEKFVKGLLTGLRESHEAKGRELVATRSDPSDIPAPGSFRVSTMITAPGATIYFTGYVLPLKSAYMLQHYSDAPKESPVFNAFVRSFRLVNPAAAAPLKNPFGPAAPFFFYMGLLVACIGLGALVNAVARRRLVSGAYVGLVLILIVMILKIAGELAGGLNAEKVGGYVGEALIPALIALWAHGRHTKSRPTRTRA